MSSISKWIYLGFLVAFIAGCQSTVQGDEISGCKEIAFVVNTDSGSQIYAACPDGSQLTNLSKNSFNDFDPAWSPDGKQIAFASTRSGISQIYLMDRAGGFSRKLTGDLQNDDPIWLPDGKRIAFRTTDGQGLWGWRVLNLEDGQIIQFSEPSYDFFFTRPAWSPDGQSLAYMSLIEQAARNDGSSQIHIKTLDGAQDVALTEDTWANILPAWSPDGKQIAFLSERDGAYNTFALYVIGVDGVGLRRLTKPIYSEDSSFSWSADGKFIILSRITNPTGFEIVNVKTKRTTLFSPSPEFLSVASPAWQP